MRIVITGRHVGVTQAMQEYAREKVEKLEHIYGRMTKVEVTLSVVHDAQVAEIVADANRGHRLVGKAESPDMYAAIDLAEAKVAHQLHKHKERLTDHHRGERGADAFKGEPPAAAAGGPEEKEETYGDVIDKLGED